MHPLARSFVVGLLWSGARRRYAMERPTVVAITGSVGKTSAKDAIATVLAASGRPVIKTIGNLNTETGVPLSLLGLSEQPAGLSGWLAACVRALFPPHLRASERPYYVLEYSTDKPGDIPFLASQLPIDVAVITRITPAHAEFFPVFADYVAEKRSLLKGLREGGYAVLNADDPNQEGVDGPVCQYAITEKRPQAESVVAHHLAYGSEGVGCSIEYVIPKRMDAIGRTQPRSFKVQTQVLGSHQLMPLLAAAAVGFREEVSPEAIKQALESIVPPPGRGRVIPGRKGITIVDDTYNASPEAVKAGLDMLRAFAGKRRVVAVLGRMNELGKDAPRFHEEVAAHAAGKVDFLVLVGEYAALSAKAAVKAGLPKVQCITFDTTQHLIDKLDQLVLREDVVYMKGSQNGVRLEKAVKALMLHPNEAAKLLVRQSGQWK